MKPGSRAFALTFALACMLLPATSRTLEEADAKSKKSTETGLVSLHEHEEVNIGANVEGTLGDLEGLNANRSQAGRRRRRGSKSSSTTTRRRSGKSRRRRGSKSSSTTTRRRSG